MALIRNCTKASMKSLKELPTALTSLLPCHMPQTPRPTNPIYPSFVLSKSEPSCAYARDVSWLLPQVVTDVIVNGDNGPVSDIAPIYMPTWSAHNSLASETLPVTYVNSPPMLAALAHG